MKEKCPSNQFLVIRSWYSTNLSVSCWLCGRREVGIIRQFLPCCVSWIRLPVSRSWSRATNVNNIYSSLSDIDYLLNTHLGLQVNVQQEELADSQNINILLSENININPFKEKDSDEWSEWQWLVLQCPTSYVKTINLEKIIVFSWAPGKFCVEIIVSNEMAEDIIVSNDNLHCQVWLSSVTQLDIDQAHTSYQNFTDSHQW